jgi:hypothetical protein
MDEAGNGVDTVFGRKIERNLKIVRKQQRIEYIWQSVTYNKPPLQLNLNRTNLNCYDIYSNSTLV